MKRNKTVLLAVIVVIILTPTVIGQQNESVKLLPSDIRDGDSFGYAVGLSGDLAVVGAPYHDDSQGTPAFVFRFDPASGTWIEEQRLYGSATHFLDRYGGCVAVSGNVIVVGADTDDTQGDNAGAAYVFRYDPGAGVWNQEAKLLASDGEPQDCFGEKLSSDDDVLLIGARTEDDNGAGSGAAYIFRYDSGTAQWTEEAKLLASDGAPHDNFGCVALSGDVALIGAMGANASGTDSGAAYVYRHDPVSGAWNEEAKLLASDGLPWDWFGAFVALSDDLAAIGSTGNDANGAGSGAVYLFRYDAVAKQWNEEAKLLASDGSQGDIFGRGVAVEGDVVLASAIKAGLGGQAYVFRHDTVKGQWEEQKIILASDGELGFRFGWSVALSGNLALIGDIQGYSGYDTGAAYICDVTPGGPPYSLYFTPTPVRAGEPERFTATNGTPAGMTYLVSSQTGPGSTYVPPLNATLGIANPFLHASRPANGLGTISGWLNVPASVSGRTIWFQAIQYGRVSNVVAATIQ